MLLSWEESVTNFDKLYRTRDLPVVTSFNKLIKKILFFRNKIAGLSGFRNKSARMLWFLQQKCMYVVIFATTIVFWGSLL